MYFILIILEKTLDFFLMVITLGKHFKMVFHRPERASMVCMWEHESLEHCTGNPGNEPRSIP